MILLPLLSDSLVPRGSKTLFLQYMRYFKSRMSSEPITTTALSFGNVARMARKPALCFCPSGSFPVTLRFTEHPCEVNRCCNRQKAGHGISRTYGTRSRQSRSVRIELGTRSLPSRSQTSVTGCHFELEAPVA
eukprot:scaffold2284_cov402-Prasinococcus_capsulatus_cf.AAC.11